MKKKVLCAWLIGLCLVSCTTKQEEQIQPLSTLDVISTIGMEPSYIASIQNFEQSTHVKINDISVTATNQWVEELMQEFTQSGALPDVLFFFTGSVVKPLIDENIFVSLDEIRAEYPEYASNIRNFAMNFMYEFDGEQYAVPVKGFWEGLFCNADLFEAYNIPLPTDWDSFLYAIETFQKYDIIPLSTSLNESPNYVIEHMILAQGGVIGHQNIPYNYISEAWVQGLEQIKNIYDMGAFSSETRTMTNLEATQEFSDKKSAMLIEGSWAVTEMADHETVIVLPIPSVLEENNVEIISGFTSGFYITRQAWDDRTKRDLAVKFVLEMTTNESILGLCAGSGAPSIESDISKDMTLLEKSTIELQQNATQSLLPIDARIHYLAWNYLLEKIPELLDGKIDAQTIVSEIIKMNRML